MKKSLITLALIQGALTLCFSIASATAAEIGQSPIDITPVAAATEESPSRTKKHAKHLSKFSYSIGPNVGLFYVHRTPVVTINYRDKNGTAKQKKYRASLHCYGPRAEWGVRFDTIWFTSKNCDFCESNDVIRLGMGVDIALPLLGILLSRAVQVEETENYLNSSSFTYVPLLDHPGGMIILAPVFGFSGGLGIITSGTLTPMPSDDDEDDEE